MKGEQRRQQRLLEKRETQQMSTPIRICSRVFPTTFPGFPLLLRERILVAADHVAPKIWEPKTREGRKSKYCRYEKGYSVRARKEFVTSFIIS